jgi:tetratricopeptide (TPR) repeat protein
MSSLPGIVSSLRVGWRGFPRYVLLILVSLLVATIPIHAQDLSATFDAANKLYEQGRYSEAAAGYEKIVQSGHRSDTVYFNLGDAWFKADQTGRAIAAWRLGEKLAPRDPDLRFNLQFARKKVTGSDAAPGATWQRALTTLTLNEWTVIASTTIWLWFLLLALREFRPQLRNALSGYTATAGVAAFLLAGCVAGAANLRFNTVSAVVIVPEAITRSGPLEEAKVLHQFRDGVELTVTDQKDLMVRGEKQTWFQVRDRVNRTGWLQSDQVALVK